MEGILGKKLGMTQIFTADGATVPVTVVQAGPVRGACSAGPRSKDGYEAVQLGLVEAKPPRHVTKPQQGHFKKAGATPMRKLAEFAVDADEALNRRRPGQGLDLPGAGVRRRRRHEQGQGLPGRDEAPRLPRRPRHPRLDVPSRAGLDRRLVASRRASIPACRAPGRMGGERMTTKNLLVVKIDEEKNLIYLRGSVPGAPNGYVAIKRAKRG